MIVMIRMMDMDVDVDVDMAIKMRDEKIIITPE